jgi:cytochrome c oxidase subunit I
VNRCAAAIGFIFLFTVGGVTGVMPANAALHRYLQETYSLPYAMSIGATFGIFAAPYHWLDRTEPLG